ncbi:MAG: nickel pincer cofactor biosynthesis protein LarC [Bacillota bacterium]
MKAVYFDCFSGISGDMCLGALLDAGLDFSALCKGLKGLGLSDYNISAKKVLKQGISATKVDVHLENREATSPRRLEDITSIIQRSKLPKEVKKNACLVFENLVEAEAKVHGVPVQDAHLHEAGATDAIVDVVGTVLGLHLLGISAVYTSPVPLGGGTVQSEHGLLPVPTPAVMELVKGMPTAPSPAQTELVTPTGAALVASLAHGIGPMPLLTAEEVGYGAGAKDLSHANVLRVVIGEIAEGAQTKDFTRGTIAVVETTIDDMNPEFYSSLGNELLANGAVDYFFTPIYMKKSRSGVKVTILCSAKDAETIAVKLMQETTTLGCRIRTEQRIMSDRHFLIVATPYGEVDVKYSLNTNTISPEYESCARKAKSAGVPVKMVYDAAIAEAWKLLKKQRS